MAKEDILKLALRGLLVAAVWYDTEFKCCRVCASSMRDRNGFGDIVHKTTCPVYKGQEALKIVGEVQQSNRLAQAVPTGNTSVATTTSQRRPTPGNRPNVRKSDGQGTGLRRGQDAKGKKNIHR